MARSTTAAPDAKHPQDDEADVCLGNLGAENEQIVTNVLSYFKEEATRSRLLCPLKRVCRRTAQATGLSKSAVVGALGDRGPSLTPELESDDAAGLHRLAGDAAGLCALRRQILFHCANYGKPPSLRVVCDMIREQCNASCTRSAAVTLLDRLGFRLRRLPGSNARLLLEDSQQVSGLQMSLSDASGRRPLRRGLATAARLEGLSNERWRRNEWPSCRSHFASQHSASEKAKRPQT